MADHKSLNVIGFIMSAVTAAVVLVGIFVVQGHITGRYVMERPSSSTAL